MRKSVLVFLLACGAGCTSTETDEDLGSTNMEVATDPERFAMIFMANDGYGAAEIDRWQTSPRRPASNG
jgi:hypothetical protein